MPGIAMIGAQWGDEGKGKVVDALAAEADLVVRYSGGANAGHTVVVGDEVFKLHHLTCGTLHDRPASVLGGGMVIDPWTFLEELDGLAARRDPGPVHLSHEAHLVLPHHKKNDEGGGFVGTTSATSSTTPRSSSAWAGSSRPNPTPPLGLAGRASRWRWPSSSRCVSGWRRW